MKENAGMTRADALFAQKIKSESTRYESLIYEAERYIWRHPETGYREFQTSKYLEEQFEKLGYSLTRAGNIPGFYTVVDTKREGPTVLILGELDSLICKNHPEAAERTGYVHACGHNAQAATLLGIAAVLQNESILSTLCGKIMLCAVPAEEMIEIEYRDELIKSGTIKYYGGKSEFLSRGYFDGVDMAMMVHASVAFSVTTGAVGCIAKVVHYKGKAAHAGGAPWSGKNALYAATCGIAAANALRETFPEGDVIRFHPIITHGGEAVNAIPELVKIEAYVRGVSYDAMVRENNKINQALCGAALSLGTNIDVLDTPGYSPLMNAPSLVALTKEAADMIIPEENLQIFPSISSGSTDMGDLSCIMPVVHPYAGGAVGTTHGTDYFIADAKRACKKSAELQLMMLYLLLKDGAMRAKEIIAAFRPLFSSKEDYFSFVSSLKTQGERIDYREDGTATVRLV